MSYTFENPFAYFNNPANSNPVGLGRLYIGLIDVDPVNPLNQVQVYAVQPDGSELAIPQPVVLLAGGVPSYNGAPIQLKVNAEQMSVKVTTSGGALVVYTARWSAGITVAELADPDTDIVIAGESAQSIAELRGDLSEGSADIGGISAKKIAVRVESTKSLRDFTVDNSVTGTGTLVPLSAVFPNLAAAQAIYPFVTSLTQSLDWAVIKAAMVWGAAQTLPCHIECEDGKYMVNDFLRLNDSLNCLTPVEDVTFIGGGSHRSYDNGDSSPFSISASGTFDTLIDLRASRKLKLQGIGIFAPSTINKIIRLGSEGCSNISQMSRVATLENIMVYGGQRNLDAYLISGLLAKTNNFSRAAARGLNLNACGDSEFTENLVNNCGPILTGGIGSNYYDGCAVIFYGGGGSNRWSGGKIEVVSKGILLDNVHTIGVHEVTFDKNKEFALAISGNQDTEGKTTNFGYQPRNISVTSNNFICNGWDSAYRSHIWLANSGTDLELSVTLTGNTFGYGGQNAIPLDTYVDGSGIYGVGPYRCIRANNSELGDSSIRVSSSGNKYNGGATDLTFESYSGNVKFLSDGSDEMNLPVITQSGAEQFGTEVERLVTFSWDPGDIPAGSSVQSPVTPASGLGFSSSIDIAAPSSLLGLQLWAYTTSNGNFVGRYHNPTGSTIAGPSGTHTIRYTLKSWQIDEFL
jgi:Head binding